MEITAAWITYVVFPFGILPFTYVLSFVFTDDSSSQSYTMFIHFFTVALISTIVYALRIVAD